DRTNWRWGKKDINILMLSVVYKGIAIPLFWTSWRINAMERSTRVSQAI
ncbi:TPA: IS4 family transposase, partial [Legionella pneumophila]|nr:IS4 family transposase [Legionella pneumophila]